MEIQATNNRFISHILAEKNFFQRLLLKYRLKKSLSKLAPSYDDMVQMAECLYFLDAVYLFENNCDINGISGMVNIRKGQRTITVKANKVQSIVIALRFPDMIEIEIFNGSKLRTNISFRDGQADVDDKYRELLFIHINNDLMNSFTKVLLNYI